MVEQQMTTRLTFVFPEEIKNLLIELYVFYILTVTEIITWTGWTSTSNIPSERIYMNGNSYMCRLLCISEEGGGEVFPSFLIW